MPADRRASSDLESGSAVIILTGGAQPGGPESRPAKPAPTTSSAKSGDLAVLRARIQALMRRRLFQDENGRVVEELKARELES